jgi:hypothetical protein
MTMQPETAISVKGLGLSATGPRRTMKHTAHFRKSRTTCHGINRSRFRGCG